MIEEIADYLVERIAFLKGWDRDKFYKMVRWYAYHGLVFACKYEGKIVGASMVRVINKDDEYARDEPYNHNPDGDTYYVEFMASDDKRARHRMIDMVIEKLGQKLYVRYEKFKDCNRLVTLPANKFKTLHQIG